MSRTQPALTSTQSSKFRFLGFWVGWKVPDVLWDYRVGSQDHVGKGPMHSPKHSQLYCVQLTGMPVSPLATFQPRAYSWERTGKQGGGDGKDVGITRIYISLDGIWDPSSYPIHLCTYKNIFSLLYSSEKVLRPSHLSLLSVIIPRPCFLVRLFPSYPDWPSTLGSSNPLASASRVARTSH